MKTDSVHDHLRMRLLSRAGIFDAPRGGFRPDELRALESSEWSSEFERLMRNRMLMGALRYGRMSIKKLKKTRWDLLGAVRIKIMQYEETGNTEYLVDIANYCLIAFECDDHPSKHFNALDDHRDHCKTK